MMKTIRETLHRPRAVFSGVIGLLLVVMSVWMPAASAQDGPAPQAEPAGDPGPDAGFAVQPSGPDGPGSRDWFVYTLDPGNTFGDTVSISNLSERPVRFRIQATDAVSVDDVAGFGALRIDQEPTDVGTWIKLAAEEYTVAPGRRIDVPFSITVPDDAEPGDHAGAILAYDADAGPLDPDQAPEGVSLDVHTRIGARVYVRVGGDFAPRLRIDALDVDRKGGTATVTWDVRNTGNTRLSPSAEVRVTGLFGRTIRTVPVQQLPELLPGANYVGAAIVSGLPRLEPLTAHLMVSAEGARTERSKQFAGYLPILMMLLVLGLLIGGVIWRRRRRRRRLLGPPPPPQRSSGRVPVSA